MDKQTTPTNTPVIGEALKLTETYADNALNHPALSENVLALRTALTSIQMTVRAALNNEPLPELVLPPS